MDRVWVAAAALVLFGGPALAIGSECPGEFVRDAQGYDFGQRRPNLVKAGPVVAKGTRGVFVGKSRIKGRTYAMLTSSFMYLSTDIRLTPPGCRLDYLDPNEPD